MLREEKFEEPMKSVQEVGKDTETKCEERERPKHTALWKEVTVLLGVLVDGSVTYSAKQYKVWSRRWRR